MFEGGKEVGRRGVWLLVVVLFGVALIVFVYPQIRALRLQTKAGKLIEEHVAWVQEEQPETAEGNFYCIIPTMQSGSLEGNNLDQAIQWLNEAKSLAPNNVHSSFLLGQAYCLKEDYERAVDALDEFLILRPENLLARAEIGFAFSALARSAADPQVAQTYQSVSLQYLEQAGFSETSFFNLGDAAFKQERYQDALVWYRMGEKNGYLPNLGYYRLSLLETVQTGKTGHADYLPKESIIVIDDLITFRPETFFYITDGTPATVIQHNDKPVSVLWSKTDEIGVMLVAIEYGTYCIRLEALDQKPEPTELELKLDFKPIMKVVLVEGNEFWKTFETEVILEPGSHLLSVDFLNDYRVEGVIDRNGYLGTITVQRCQ